MNQPEPFTLESQRFGGQTFEPERDGSRLQAQLRRVFHLMQDGQWRTLRQISAITGDPETSVSARLRDLRKRKFGGYAVRRRYMERGLFAYRLEIF